MVIGYYSQAENRAAIALVDLKAEHLRNPIQLDITQPRLSWKIQSNDPTRKNIRQQSYHILVASSPEILASNKADLWDSGQVMSSQSILIPYQGPKLQSRQACYWKVRITDNNGQQSDFSDPASWEMALLNPEDWSGSQWIGLEKDSRDHAYASRTHAGNNKILSPHPSPLFRKELILPEKKILKARAYVSGVGYSELYINGNKISDHVLDPGQTNYEKHTFYVVHDISADLKPGRNALGVWLGNGFYGQNIGFAQAFGYGQPSVRAKLYIEYTDGSTEEYGTDTSWKACVSPIVFDNVYWGETYDARLEIPNWSKPGLNDSNWQTAIPVKSPCPDAQLRPQLLPPIKEIERLKPVQVRQTKPETYIIDFGKNIAGWVHIKVSQNPGDVITIIPAEVLSEDKTHVDQGTIGAAPGNTPKFLYICKGNGTESWSPRFTYTGFQYIEISGLTNASDAKNIEAVFVRSAVPKTGSFSSSNELLNKQYQASLLSLEGNWHSLPEDCPHREKCGWLGDAHATADLCLYNYDITRFYSKYIRDIQDSLRMDKRADTVIPNAAGIPTMIAPGKRGNRIATIDWGVAYLIVPWQTYLHTGDIQVFKPHYENYKNFIKYYQTFKNKQGVIDNGLGDWCPPNWDRRKAPEYMECHPFVSGTAFYYQALQIAGQMAQVLGDTQYKEWCLQEADNIQKAFDNVYLKPIEGSTLKHYGSQTATVMALKLGMVPPDQIQNRVAALVFDINKLHGGHHACGIHGLRHLYTVLADQGQQDLVYKMITDTTYPSPGYVLSFGLTTWPERRFEWGKVKFSNSFNHPMNGGFTAFMHESLGGLRPDAAAPGYKHFRLEPKLTDQIKWVKTSVESPYGKIRSEWKNNADQFFWEVEIPANTTATILFPHAPGREWMQENKNIQSKLIPVTENKQKRFQYTIGSGTYRFSVK